ncbi:hypothetical protein LYSHEL_00340 [Lysobacter helvus]|uniref:Uncharacterized protein n=2 Tax=Lysobacteraceae TaxID=32033 RepID=A0ABM7Q1C4_9GAMM|nr:MULTISPECIES: hypothetical protein [Lysobacter]BCT91010.1 hypothetical protein LYSCAS_00340 [Lysobacter caseinilyticus]BCT94163.1 hypothetical protein LYSHEL_00340 [Lysobacter helvus]
MTNTPKPLAIHKAMSTLVWPKFGPGMLLEHGDLELLPAYTREINRLMFRSLFGCGVVCGLKVDVAVHCGKPRITVECGLAIDCEGDPVYVPKTQVFDLDGECDTKFEFPLWVVLCGTSKCCAPRTAACSCDDDETPAVCTRERDAFEIRVLDAALGCGCQDSPTTGIWDTPCKCADPSMLCHQNHYNGVCGCKDGDCDCCDCDCVVLARIDETNDAEKPWEADHSVRRFIRPVLMRDPLVAPPQAQAVGTLTNTMVAKKVVRPRGTIATITPPNT